jgi:hypothetical protein
VQGLPCEGEDGTVVAEGVVVPDAGISVEDKDLYHRGVNWQELINAADATTKAGPRTPAMGMVDGILVPFPGDGLMNAEEVAVIETEKPYVGEPSFVSCRMYNTAMSALAELARIERDNSPTNIVSRPFVEYLKRLGFLL